MGASSDRLNFGVIGFRMGWTHASRLAALDGATLAAVAEVNAEARPDAEQFGARFYTDYRQMLTQERLDAVVVAVPHYLLAEIGRVCLEHGLHVLVEKPMAHTLEAARQLVATAARVGRQLAVGYQWRCHPQTQRVKAMLVAGELGQVALAHAFWVNYAPEEYFQTAPWKGERARGGGPTLLVASHVVDTFRYLLGEVTQVHTLFNKQRGRDVEDSAVVNLRFQGGTLASMVFGTAALNIPGHTRTFYLLGDRASVAYPPLVKAWYPWFSPHSFYRQREQALAPTVRDIPVAGADPYTELLRNFCAAIRGEAVLACPGPDGLRTFEVLAEIIAQGDALLP